MKTLNSEKAVANLDDADSFESSDFLTSKGSGDDAKGGNLIVVKQPTKRIDSGNAKPE